MSDKEAVTMIREMLGRPAIHVVVLGAIIAAAYLVAKGPPADDETRLVTVTGGDILQLEASFQRTWQREPTAEELRGALEMHIRQEILYREALARGYDRDDLVVRRAMQQKMEFLAASQALEKPPTDEEIEAFFSLRRERYRQPAVFSFFQVFVSSERGAAEAERRAFKLLEELRREDPGDFDIADWGDRIMLDSSHVSKTQQEVDSLFGTGFSTALLDIEPGRWQGPVPSGYGLHLVKVVRREDSRIPDWIEVRGRVVADMEFEARTSARDQLYQEIAQGYEIMIDRSAESLLEPID